MFSYYRDPIIHPFEKTTFKKHRCRFPYHPYGRICIGVVYDLNVHRFVKAPSRKRQLSPLRGVSARKRRKETVHDSSVDMDVVSDANSEPGVFSNVVHVTSYNEKLFWCRGGRNSGQWFQLFVVYFADHVQ